MPATLPHPALVLACLAAALSLGGCRPRPSLQREFQDIVRAEFDGHPAPAPRVLDAKAIRALPEPVRRYVAYSGALGRPVPWNLRVEFDAVMRRKPGDAGMRARSVQINFFDPPSRSFFMRARMAGLPVQVLHHYAAGEATMQVCALGLFRMVDIRSRDLFKAECVTFLNDLCLMAPGRLIDPRLRWKPLDTGKAEVAFNHHGVTVKAVLHIAPDGRLYNFVSDDRLALQDDGSLKSYRFSTPLTDYQDFDGLRLGSHGDAIYDYPEGPFTYGTFDMKSAETNLAVPAKY
jgi:hypothetical protein